MCHYWRAGATQVVQLARFLNSARPHTGSTCFSDAQILRMRAHGFHSCSTASRFARCVCWWSIGFLHTYICTEYIYMYMSWNTCTPDLLESMCPPRGVSCPSTHHIHRQSMSIPKNVSVSQYGGNVNNTIRTFLEQKPTLCVCLLGEYTMAHCTYMCTFVGSVHKHTSAMQCIIGERKQAN